MKFYSSMVFGCLLAAAMIPVTASAANIIAEGVVDRITIGNGSDTGANIEVKLKNDVRTYLVHVSHNLNDASGPGLLQLLLQSKTGGQGENPGVPVELACYNGCPVNTFNIVTLK